MNATADSNIVDGSAPFYQVMIWNGLHDARKLYKAYREEDDAKLAVAALRMHGMDAELVTVGKA
jgi:hypothetical protein